MDQSSSVPSASPTPAPTPGSTPTPPSTSSHSTALLVGVSVLIGLLIGIFGFMVWQRTSNSTPTPAPIVVIPNETPTSTPSITPTSTASHVDTREAAVNVAWKSGVIAVPSEAFGTIIPANRFETRNPTGYQGGIDDAVPYYKFSYDFYAQGQVTDGPYQGHLVYGAKQIDREVDLGMDQTQVPEFFNLLVSPDKREVRIVGLAGSSVFEPVWKDVIYAPKLRLNVSDFPATLTLENGKTVRRADLSSKAAPMPLCGGSTGCVDRLPLARTTDGRSLYSGPTGSYLTDQTVKPGCVVLYRENGEGAVYESGISTAVRDPQMGTDESYPAPRVVTPAQLTWDAAYANTSTFRAHEVGGCGGIDCLRVLSSNELREQDLVQAGTVANGEPIFVFKPEALRQRPTVLNEVYDSWYDYDSGSNQKPSIEEFLRRVKVPVLFWKDAFGRYVAYKNTIAVPLAECGKPVIYLYPPQTQAVHVKLPSFIQVTVSDPTYPTEGWHVTAHPSGKLIMKDGSSVSSLFWEGLGVNYTVPTTGFVVKDGQVESFLKTTLARYGLNAQESKDFMEFWVPRMTGAPYYRISFLTNDWNKQVPLHVSPAPQTNIRLFMDWQRLAGPIQLPEPTITTPVRNGFTLVEWGGLLR